MNQAIRDKALETFLEYKPRMLDVVDREKFSGEFVRFPVFIDGVLDTVVYRVKDKRFVAIEMDFCDESAPVEPWFGNTGLAEKTRIEILPIPEHLQ